jgi:uncharacterized coiled-coil protein SlyX
MKKEQQIEDFDFGFSFSEISTEEVEEKITKEKQTTDELNRRLELLYSTIDIFLSNLSKNPEKTTINWPNRVEKITEFREKLKSIVEGK